MQRAEMQKSTVNVIFVNVGSEALNVSYNAAQCICMSIYNITFKLLLMICEVYKTQKSSLKLSSWLGYISHWTWSYTTAWTAKVNF